MTHRERSELQQMKDRLKDLPALLVKCGLVQEAAVEDPEGYDDHRTVGNIDALRELLSGDKA